MTTAAIPQTQTTIPQALANPTPSGILRLLAMCGPRGYTITTGEAFQVAMDLVRRGLARYFDVLGAGVPVFAITEAGKKHLRDGAPAPEGELLAALDVLTTTAQINAARDFAEGNPVPRLRKARQRCAWLHRDFGGRSFPYPEAFEYLRTTHHIEPVTVWANGSRWTVGWQLTARGHELHARLTASATPQPVHTTRALVVSPPRALVVAGHFPQVFGSIEQPQPAPAPAPKLAPARAPFSSENVKIGAGRWDAGAFHRAVEVARALYDAGRWHGLGTLYVNHPYTVSGKLARADYDADVLVTGEDYRVELF